MRTALKLSPAEIAEAVEREPLIGISAACRLMEMLPPNFKRDAKPRLTEVPVDGNASVYFRSEVEQLARERAAAKASRNGKHG